MLFLWHLSSTHTYICRLSGPSSMWVTQHNPEAKPFSVEAHLSTSHLHLDWFPPVCLVISVPCPLYPQPLVSRLLLIFCLPLVSTAWPQTLTLLAPFLSPLPCLALVLTSLQAVFPAPSLVILAIVSEKHHSSFGNPDPASKSPRHRCPISWAKIFAWSMMASIPLSRIRIDL